MSKKEQTVHITHMGLGNKTVEVREAEGGVKTTVFKDVVLLGPESCNPDSAIDGNALQYTPSFMESAAPFYNGVRVYLNHCESWDDRSNRDLTKMMGVAENAREEGGKLRADLVIVNTNATEHAVGLMQAFPEKVAMSHDARCMVLEESAEAVEMVLLRSVDIVPMGGTTKNLYESAGDPGRKETPTNDTMKTEELEAQVTKLTADLSESKGKVKDLTEKNAELTASAMINKELSESALPEKSQNKLRTLLQGRDEAFVKDAIKTEKDHLESLGNPVVGAPAEVETEAKPGEKETKEAAGDALVAELSSFVGVEVETK